jgi:hypothetical protein
MGTLTRGVPCFKTSTKGFIEEGRTEDRSKTMIVTREWVMRHRTPNGGWTRAQLDAIGVKWPPKRGWVVTVIGRDLPDDAVQAFECRTQLWRGGVDDADTTEESQA